jgi:phosphoribosylanthranilate isomerase
MADFSLPMKTRIKICGITNHEDAALALEFGADALGFNFYPASPRYISPRGAREIIRRLPPLASMVGVFVNVTDPEQVQMIARESGVQVLQLHGDETVAYCRRLAEWSLIKAIRVPEEGIHSDLSAYPVQAILLDASDDRWFGGTGKTLDWKRVRNGIGGLRILLAGGLNASNVADAIRIVQPYGVDVCSGVESHPGKKDSAKLAAFMNEVGNAAR